MRRNAGFTLIEIAIAVFILLLIVVIAVPSLTGVMADRRLHRSLDQFNSLVRQAQERSVNERRPYLLVWSRDLISLRPVATKKGEVEPGVTLPVRKGEVFALRLPAALMDSPPPEWVFWPSGNCEPAVISFKGVDGAWTANYSPLTARAELTAYATR
ncbi:MAG: prepilin-type N-terminal cleavage/methylation domain-containing protein [Verrucomicrobiota bacterium]